MDKVIIVDDDPAILALLQGMLKATGNEVVAVNKGRNVLDAVLDHRPDLILLDINMPEMDGFQVCELLKREEQAADIPVIFLSGLHDTADKIRGFQCGGVDYITKPFNVEEVHARVKTHLRLRALQNRLAYQKALEEKAREISEAQLATIFAIAKLAEYRDEDTGQHLDRVREYCRILAEELSHDPSYADHISPDFVDCIKHAAPLHDIGKVAIPDSILLKPGRLTTEEFERMKSHTVIGAENLQIVYNNYPGNAFVGMGIEIALYHHERWDGSGYPDGLVGKNIPLSARIMALADVYDALRSERCYRQGLSHQETKSLMLDKDPGHFDPTVVEAFLRLETEFCRIYETLNR